MLYFLELSPHFRATFLAILFIVNYSNICMVLFYRKKGIMKVSLSLCCIICMAILLLYGTSVYYLNYNIQMGELFFEISKKPIIFSIVFLCINICILVYIAIKEWKNHKGSITDSSIKESIDHLTTGLCFADANGMVLLINHLMRELCYEITNEELQDANSFWNILKEGNLPQNVKRLSKGEEPEICLSDGTIWTFQKNVINTMIQLTAIQTTELHKLTEEIIKKNHELKEKNIYLQKYKENIESYISEKERLETKIQIHSKFGQALLATRYAIQNDKESLQEVLDLWKQNITMLQSTTKIERNEYSIEQLLKFATSVNICMKIIGEFPKETRIHHLWFDVAVEALLNATRHGKAKNLQIQLSETEREYCIRCSNDGIVPKNGIVESGGLIALRYKVKKFHGDMNIFVEDNFILNVIIPKMEDKI